MFITATGAKEQGSRRAQRQVRQRSVIQRWGKGTGRQVGRLRVRQSGQAGGYRARIGNAQKPEGRGKRDWGKAGAYTKMLVGLTNREHRYKYTGDNGGDGQHLEGGGYNHKDR